MRRTQRGFSLMELLIAMALTGVVMAAAVTVYQRSVQVSTLVATRAELQSELRGGLNQITRDLNQAGTGIPLGGIPIPSSTSTPAGNDPIFGCDASACYLTSGKNVLSGGTLNKIVPGNRTGITTSEPTDSIVIVYADPIAPAGDLTSSATGLDWSPYATTNVADDGSSLTMPPGTTPAINDPVKGLMAGDILLMQNDKGSALVVVTGFDAAARRIDFAANDPFKLNQPGNATLGTLASLRIDPLPGPGVPHYKPVAVSRIMMITYFVWQDPNDGHYMLMRQVNGRTASPVAEYIEDFQATYDVVDITKNPVVLAGNLPDAAIGTPPAPQPNQIRKINLTITARSPQKNAHGDYDRMSIATSVGPRNMSFHDKYN